MGISISSESTKFFTLLKLRICQEKKVFLSSFTLCECVSGTLQVTEKIMAFSSTLFRPQTTLCDINKFYTTDQNWE